MSIQSNWKMYKRYMKLKDFFGCWMSYRNIWIDADFVFLFMRIIPKRCFFKFRHLTYNRSRNQLVYVLSYNFFELSAVLITDKCWIIYHRWLLDLSFTILLFALLYWLFVNCVNKSIWPLKNAALWLNNLNGIYFRLKFNGC